MVLVAHMFDIDSIEIPFPCPRCCFLNDISLKEVRLRQVRLCRGCHSTIQLEDEMNTVRTAVRNINRQLRQLRDQFSGTSGLQINI